MYLDQILTYMVWPVFILVSWFIINSAVILYEKKYSKSEEKAEQI